MRHQALARLGERKVPGIISVKHGGEEETFELLPAVAAMPIAGMPRETPRRMI